MTNLTFQEQLAWFKFWGNVKYKISKAAISAAKGNMTKQRFFAKCAEHMSQKNDPLFDYFGVLDVLTDLLNNIDTSDDEQRRIFIDHNYSKICAGEIAHNHCEHILHLVEATTTDEKRELSEVISSHQKDMNLSMIEIDKLLKKLPFE